MSKLDEKRPSYAQFNVLVQKWHLAYFVLIVCHFGLFLDIDLKFVLDFGSTFFGGLNQKSAMICMRKIHIYIDSERFRRIH